jgi:hypothetical protein
MLFGSVVVLAGIAAGCRYDPAYENLICAPGALCPDGLVCDPVSKRCVRPGTEPSPDGPDAVDAGDMGPDDGGPDADDTDGGADAFDGDAETDSDPCGGCLPNRYCNEAASNGPTCEMCVIQHHCGPDCVDCGDVLTCQHRGDAWCCFPDSCGPPEQCLTGTCEGNFVCASPDKGQSWIWQPQGNLASCLLDGLTGPVADNRCYNSTNLLFHCPWDGICQNGSCVLVSGEGTRTHPCVFGCVSESKPARCRRHLADGEICLYNFDCESFCCSKGQNAICIPYDESLCKGMRTRHHCDTNGCDYTFVAQGPANDRHDIGSWASVSGDSASDCDQDFDCDSQQCGSVSKKCTFYNTCVGNESGDDSIRGIYFCAAPGGHQTHISQVTDTAAEPQPSECE